MQNLSKVFQNYILLMKIRLKRRGDAETKGVDHYTSLVWLIFLAYLYQKVKHVNEAS